MNSFFLLFPILFSVHWHRLEACDDMRRDVLRQVLQRHLQRPRKEVQKVQRAQGLVRHHLAVLHLLLGRVERNDNDADVLSEKSKEVVAHPAVELLDEREHAQHECDGVKGLIATLLRQKGVDAVVVRELIHRAQELHKQHGAELRQRLRRHIDLSEDLRHATRVDVRRQGRHRRGWVRHLRGVLVMRVHVAEDALVERRHGLEEAARAELRAESQLVSNETSDELRAADKGEVVGEVKLHRRPLVVVAGRVLRQAVVRREQCQKRTEAVVVARRQRGDDLADACERCLDVLGDEEAKEPVEAVEPLRRDAVVDAGEEPGADDLTPHLARHVVPAAEVVDVVEAPRVRERQQALHEAPEETVDIVARLEVGDRHRVALVLALPVRDEVEHELIALHVDVEVNDARVLLLPRLEAVDADVVLDVLKRGAHAIEQNAELLQVPVEVLNCERLLLVEAEGTVQLVRDLVDEFAAHTFLEETLRFDVDDAHQCPLHRQNTIRELGDLARRHGVAGTHVELRDLLDLVLLQLRLALLQHRHLDLHNVLELLEDGHGDHVQHLAHEGHELRTVVLRDGRHRGGEELIRASGLRDAREGQLQQRR
eukprot:PhM_4_TR10036/c0_g1_i1/m.38926